MYNYVQIADGLIVGIQQSSSPVIATNLVAIAEYDSSIVGRTWVDGAPGDFPPEPVVPVNTRLTRLEFRNRLTSTEKEAIYTAAETSVAIRIWLDDLAAAEYIDLADAATIAAVNGLESLTLIGVGRADEILTP